MQVTVQFDSIFNGIIYSKGSYYTQGCVFIQASQRLNKFIFTIPINACGTQSGNDDTKTPPVRYIENTIIMQNDAMIQQLTDVARKVNVFPCSCVTLGLWAVQLDRYELRFDAVRSQGLRRPLC